MLGYSGSLALIIKADDSNKKTRSFIILQNLIFFKNYFLFERLFN